MMNKDNTFPAIAPFNTDAPITLEMAPNGGWIATQQADSRCVPNRLGAYSSAEDMLRALAGALGVSMGEKA